MIKSTVDTGLMAPVPGPLLSILHHSLTQASPALQGGAAQETKGRSSTWPGSHSKDMPELDLDACQSDSTPWPQSAAATSTLLSLTLG